MPVNQFPFGKYLLSKSIEFLFFTIIAFCAVNSRNAFSHENHHHEDISSEKDEKPIQDGVSKQAIEQVKILYTRSVEPIFDQKCMDCHSDRTRYPWYAKLPIARSIIEEDIREAKKHLDMSFGFPFKGHGSIEEDLDAIAKVVREKTMPPFRYRVLHWNSGLEEKEIKSILGWVRQSKDHLR